MQGKNCNYWNGDKYKKNNTSPKENKVYVDATCGAGNFTNILDSAKCSVIAIDQDPNTKEYANKKSREYGDRFTFLWY